MHHTVTRTTSDRPDPGVTIDSLGDGLLQRIQRRTLLEEKTGARKGVLAGANIPCQNCQN
jgi:hypothetical protein